VKPLAKILITATIALGCNGAPEAAVDRSDAAVWRLESSVQTSGTDALLQAVSPVDAQVVWVSGHDATYARTADGGRTWTAALMAGEETLQFRDVAAFDENTAYLMSSGTGDQSRIYRTDDGGDTWRLQYVADHPEAFLDCMDFWDPERGLVFGDVVDGVPFILSTSDGGGTWTRVPAEALPPAQEGEGGFAASGTCLVTGEDGRAWIAAGNAERSRVLLTTDRGDSWTVAEVPVVGGTGAGLTTIRVTAGGNGIALGGIIGGDSLRVDNVTLTTDHGVSWSLGGRLAMAGPAYGSALVDLPSGATVAVAVGPRGMDWSPDAGATWQRADTLTYWAVAFADSGAGWAVGPDGRIVRLAFVQR
jgi:photosystem II stability/assembly factor-like uncharacterized protein